MSEEDFWNASSSSSTGINFFDDDDETTLIKSDSVFSNFIPESTTLPIDSLISNKCLNLILDDITSTMESNTPPEETIRKMFHLGNLQPLDCYRTLEYKLLLLDAALDIGDGNIIIAVVIFLKKSLKYNIFITQLSKRKLALKHYLNFIKSKGILQELGDLQLATGDISNLKDIYYQLIKDNSNSEVLHRKLEQFTINYPQNLFCSDDRLEVQENIAFIRCHLSQKQHSNSLMGLIIILSGGEGKKDNSDEIILDLKKQFRVDDFQFDWAIMSVLCKLNNWDKLLSTFVKSVWVIKKRTFKSTIRPELFVMSLGKHKAPKRVLEEFLPYVGDSEKALYLAEKFGVHSYIINHYIDQKDKMAILNYMSNIEPGGEAMNQIHSALNNPEIRWKN